MSSNVTSVNVAPNATSDASTVVLVNIGGITYTSTLSTLRRLDYFKELLSKHAPGNEYFVDRDGESFRYILEYLRHLRMPALPEIVEKMERLLHEIEFYQIPLLKTMIQKKLEGLGDCFSVVTQNDGKENKMYSINSPKTIMTYIKTIVDENNIISVGTHQAVLRIRQLAHQEGYSLTNFLKNDSIITVRELYFQKTFTSIRESNLELLLSHSSIQ